VHVPTNLALFVGGGFGIRDAFPWLVPSSEGQSILLTTPALLVAVNAGFRGRLNQMLWGAAMLTAIPVFLYYGGGGGATYGYRYAMDFIPFLFALVAIALKEQRFGGNLLEKTPDRAQRGFRLLWIRLGHLQVGDRPPAGTARPRPRLRDAAAGRSRSPARPRSRAGTRPARPGRVPNRRRG
jgi:hypothetical protein